jgi:WD40 repeat protein
MNTAKKSTTLPTYSIIADILPFGEGVVYQVAFTIDGKHIITVGTPILQVGVWSIKSSSWNTTDQNNNGCCEWVCALDHGGHFVSGLAISPKGDVFVTGLHGKKILMPTYDHEKEIGLAVWSAATFEMVKKLPLYPAPLTYGTHYWLASLQFDSTGNMLAGGGFQGQCFVRTTEGEWPFLFIFKGPGTITGLAFIPSNVVMETATTQRLVLADWSSSNISVLDIVQQTAFYPIKRINEMEHFTMLKDGHTKRVHSVNYSVLHDIIISGGEDGLCMWNINNNASLMKRIENDGAAHVSVTDSFVGSYGGRHQYVELFLLPMLELLRRISMPSHLFGCGNGIGSINFSFDGNWLAGTAYLELDIEMDNDENDGYKECGQPVIVLWTS